MPMLFLILQAWKIASEHWDTDPKYSQVCKDAMQEIFLGPVEDFDDQIAVVKILEKVKEYQQSIYDYRVFYADDGMPAG